MPSAFEEVVRSVVRELDRGRELIPVDSLRSSTSFQPYRLLSRKLPSSWFWRPPYTCVNLSIKDILEPDAPEPELERGGLFHFFDAVDGQLQGRMQLSALGQGTVAGGATVSSSSSTSMNVCTLRVDPNIWETMHQERRLRQPEHKILQQLRNRRDNVYVVTEVLQTQEEVKITQTHKQEGSGQFSLPGAMCFQGESQGHLSRKHTVTIPAGSTLAFRVSQLVISSDWDILLLPDEKQRTFPQSPTGTHKGRWQGNSLRSLMPILAASVGASRGTDGSAQRTFSLCSVLGSVYDRLKFLSDGPLEEWVVTEDFQGLQAEVQAGSKELEHMERSLRQQLLGDLGRLLRDQLALQALEASLEQGLCYDGQVEPLDGPAGAVLECLVFPSREPVPELAAPVFYLLGALTVLSEAQRELLADLLQTGALLGQLKLVERLLQQSTPWQERSAVSLPPEILGSRWAQGAPEWTLLEECGLTLQMGTPQVCWEPQAQGPTCALYASLALLSWLSHDPC